MNVSRALYSQARDNASSSPVVADGVWLPDADTELRREVGALIAAIKLSGKSIIATPDFTVTEGLDGGVVIEALCDEKDIANRRTYVVLLDSKERRVSREFLTAADYDLQSFSNKLKLNISAKNICDHYESISRPKKINSKSKKKSRYIHNFYNNFPTYPEYYGFIQTNHHSDRKIERNSQ